MSWRKKSKKSKRGIWHRWKCNYRRHPNGWNPQMLEKVWIKKRWPLRLRSRLRSSKRLRKSWRDYLKILNLGPGWPRCVLMHGKLFSNWRRWNEKWRIRKSKILPHRARKPTILLRCKRKRSRIFLCSKTRWRKKLKICLIKWISRCRKTSVKTNLQLKISRKHWIPLMLRIWKTIFVLQRKRLNLTV